MTMLPTAEETAIDADTALEQLYAGHYASLVRLAVLLLRDQPLAEDVVQDSFVAMHRHWHRIVVGAALSTLIGVGAELAAPDRNDANDRIVIATRESVQETVNQVGQQVTRRNVDLQPTLTVRAGFPVRVMVSRDLVLRPFAEDRDVSQLGAAQRR